MNDVVEPTMKFFDETLAEGVTERRFELAVAGDSVTGIFWHPPEARGPRPLLLHGYGQHKRVPGLVSFAQRMVRQHGYAVAALDAPAPSEQRTPERVAPESSQRSGTARGLALPSIEERRARAQKTSDAWRAVLDALQQLEYVGRDCAVGYWGLSMGTAIGLMLLAAEPRIRCAVLGLFGARKDAGELMDAARRIEVPLLFMLQLHDEIITPEAGLKLFDSFGSQVKSMHMNPGPHGEVPPFELESYEAFFVRHLGVAE